MLEILRRSMLLHLALVFAVGMSVVVGGAGLYLNTSVTHAVYAQVNRDLIDSARLTLHRLEEDKLGPDKELLDLGDNVYLRVMTPAREVVIESKDMAQLLPRDAPVPLGPWSWWESPRKAAVRIKVLSFRYHGGWIQLARDMHPEEGVLKDFRRSLLVLLSIIPFASAALGFGLLRLGRWIRFLPYPVIGGEKAALVQVLDLMRALASTRISEDPTIDEVYRLAGISQVNAEADHLNNDQYWSRYCGLGAEPRTTNGTDYALARINP